jgi:hypothetical protein
MNLKMTITYPEVFHSLSSQGRKHKHALKLWPTPYL